MRRPWNVNLHYDGLLERLVPARASAAVDVGCGDGFLAARLSHRGTTVVGLDLDGPVLQRAQARFPDAAVLWVQADALAPPLAPGGFDAVVSNATVHQLGAPAPALAGLGQLVRPGGRLAVVTFVAVTARDLPWQVGAAAARIVAYRVRRKWHHSAPTLWPPPNTLRELRTAATTALPGSRVRRLLYGRVLVTWTAPS